MEPGWGGGGVGVASSFSALAPDWLEGQGAQPRNLLWVDATGSAPSFFSSFRDWLTVNRGCVLVSYTVLIMLALPHSSALYGLADGRGQRRSYCLD